MNLESEAVEPKEKNEPTEKDLAEQKTELLAKEKAF